MFPTLSAFDTPNDSISVDAMLTPLPSFPPPSLVRSSQSGEPTAPGQKCPNQGRSNSALSSHKPVVHRIPRVPLAPAEYERDHAPINWPAELNEDTGRVRQEWADEMIKIRKQFWLPLGAAMYWSWTEYSR